MPDTTKAKAPTVRMRLTESEARLIKARRGAAPDERRQVVAGYREPRDATDAIAVFSAFAESNWGNVSTPAWGRPEFELELPEGSVTVRAAEAGAFLDTLKDDELEALRRYRKLSREAVADPDFQARLSMARGYPDRYEDIDVEVRIIPRDDWARLRSETASVAADGPRAEWAGVAIEDGRILALRLAPPEGARWSPWGCDDAIDAESRDDLLDVRQAVQALLESHPGVKCLGLDAGKNGESRFAFAMDTASITIEIRDRRWE